MRTNVAEHESNRLHHLHAWCPSISSEAQLDQEDAAQHPFLLLSPPSASLQHCTLLQSGQNTRLQTTQRSKGLALRWDYRRKQAALCAAVLRLHTAVIVW